MNTNKLLNERNETHGPFTENARVSQAIKEAMQSSRQWNEMSDVHREALEYIAGKIGRLCAGDFTFDDTWEDVAGYAKLPIKFNHGKEAFKAEDTLLNGCAGTGCIPIEVSGESTWTCSSGITR